MNDRKPGEKFTEEAKPFVDQMRDMATKNYQKIISLGHDLGQKLQRNFAPRLGIGGTSTPRQTQQQQPSQNTSEEKDG